MITPNTQHTPDAVAQHYDDLDKWYLIVWGEHVHHGLWKTGKESQPEAVRALSDHVAQALDIQPRDTVCDIGCGYGGTARILATDYRAKVLAYTLSEAQYSYATAQANGATNPQYFLKNWFDNGLPSESANAAIAIESTEHIDDKPALFEEVHRVLKPGGRVGIYAWLATDAPTERQVQRLLEPICREGKLAGMGDTNDYKNWLTNAGFEAIEFEDLTKNVRRTWPIIIQRLILRLTWDRRAWAHLLRGPNNIFAVSVVRILVAYYTGAMRYGLFTAVKPG